MRRPHGALAGWTAGTWLALVPIAFPGQIAPSSPSAPSPPSPSAPPPSVSAPSDPPLEPPTVATIIKRFPTNEPVVAITFDACATKTHGYGFDRPVYDVLRADNVPATIFVSGRWVESHPDVMQELATDPLIEFANHSYDHPHMTRLASAAIETELDQTETALARYGKHSVAFRPPFGDFSQRVLQVARGRRLPPVLWDVVSGDPSAAVSADAMIRTVVKRTRPGSIVIFHINGRETKTATALPVILHELRARGFRFVHLSTLLYSTPAPAPAPAPITSGDPERDRPLEPMSMCGPLGAPACD